jgi:hypothetical protein
MYLRGILHSQDLMEEFRGYVRGILQPRTSTPMSTKKTLYENTRIGPKDILRIVFKIVFFEFNSVP